MILEIIPRLNVYGEMAVFSEVEEFRYLNKKFDCFI